MLGCAVLAAVAASLYPDVPSAVAQMVSVERVVQPDPQVWIPHIATVASIWSCCQALLVAYCLSALPY